MMSKKLFNMSKKLIYIPKYRFILNTQNRFNSTQAPRSLFELYSKNSEWLGVYDRHKVLKEKASRHEINIILQKEKLKRSKSDILINLQPAESEYQVRSKRVGALGTKLGTTFLWSKEGFKHLVTLVQIEKCHVMDVQISHEDGGNDLYTQMILGAHDITDEDYLAKMTREKIEWYRDRGIFPKKLWSGFPVTKDALLLPGSEITASHFVPDQLVTVQGVTVKHGFQGVMKRWGMKGQPASHGQTKTHRKMGATGGGQDPGRIFPGKKMAGHVGGSYKTTHPSKILRINTKYNILYIKGTVPGDIGGYMKIKDAFKRKKAQTLPSFPAYFESSENKLREEDLYANYICSSQDPSLEFPPYKI